MIGELFINGFDAYLTWGIYLDSSGLSTIMTPAPLKDYVEDDSRLEDGVQVLPIDSKYDARDITLTINLSAGSKAEFFANYDSFCEQLRTGYLEFRIKYLQNKVFKFRYRSCQQFSEYNMEAGKFLLRLTEHNPADR